MPRSKKFLDLAVFSVTTVVAIKSLRQILRWTAHAARQNSNGNIRYLDALGASLLPSCLQNLKTVFAGYRRGSSARLVPLNGLHDTAPNDSSTRSTSRTNIAFPDPASHRQACQQRANSFDTNHTPAPQRLLWATSVDVKGRQSRLPQTHIILSTEFVNPTV